MLMYVLQKMPHWLRGGGAAAGGMLIALSVAALIGKQGTARSAEPDSILFGRAAGATTVASYTAYLPALFAAAGPQVYQYPSCRFGVTVGGLVAPFDVVQLNAGWYLDWQSTVTPAHPGGAEYYPMVRLSQVGSGFTFQPPTATLYTAIDANPGSVWLIGNEPERRIYQDDLTPEAYARAYHYLYYLIKGRDPSARIAIGGIVQPTPLRLQYLDRVWDTYAQEYGTPMPVDVWNIHTFILREISPDHPKAQQPGYEVWGAGIPRGAQFDGVMEGELYRVSQQDDLTIFQQRIIEFRQWMASKGERDKPLIVTEYGVLFPEDYYDELGHQLSSQRVGRFMRGTFDFFRTYTDTLIGYPADGNRLVQRWAWFSVDGDPGLWGGTLFDPVSHALRPLGEDFSAYTQALPPTFDLVAARAFAEPAVVAYAGAPVTVTLKALVANAGDVSTTAPISVTFYDGPLGQTGVNVIDEPQVITRSLEGCAGYTVVSATWPGLGAGAHPFSVRAQTQAMDADVNNNSAEGVVLVATQRTYLAMLLKDSP